MIGPAILHSVSYTGSWGQAFLPLDAFVEKAAELGFQGVMLGAKRPHLSPLDYDGPALAKLRSKIEALGLGTVVIAGYTNFTADLEHGEVPNREIQIQHVDQLVRLANGLGSRIVRVFTSYESAAATYGAQWNMTVAALKECARRASDSGVVIGVQNHHDVAVGYESMLDLIRAVGEPNCQPLFDAWSPALHGDDLAKTARLFGAITPHTTIADYQLRPRFRYHPQLVNYSKELPATQAVPMGEGFIDYRAFLGALADSGFTGSVAYEMCSPLLHGGDLDTLDRYARKFLEYIDSFKSSYRTT